MNVSIMQPYFFPYIGYFQLIAQSDVFVFHDDVQYIKDGWVNRNRILGPNGEAAWLTLPVAAASHTLAVNARTYLLEANADRILRRIENAYRDAPCFGAVYPLICKIMALPDANVATFNVNLLKALSRFMRLNARFVRSSAIKGLAGLSGQSRVLAICEQVGATSYINPIGGTTLYAAEAFRQHGVALGFLQTTSPPHEGALAHLSIVDMLMKERGGAFAERLGQYRVTPAPFAEDLKRRPLLSPAPPPA